MTSKPCESKAFLLSRSQTKKLTSDRTRLNLLHLEKHNEKTADFANKNVEGRLYDRTTLKDKKALPEITLKKGTIMSLDSIASFGDVAHANIDGVQVCTPYAGTFMGT